MRNLLENHVITAWNWKEEISQDDWLNPNILLTLCENHLKSYDFGNMKQKTWEAAEHVKHKTAWRIEGTLREFRAFEPINVWFDYPIHVLDDAGSLGDLQAEEEKNSYQKMIDKRKEDAKQQNENTLNEIIVAFEGLEEDGRASAIDIAEEIGVSPDTIKRWFGNGQKSRKAYKKMFKAYIDPENRKLYLEKKNNTTNGQ